MWYDVGKSATSLHKHVLGYIAGSLADLVLTKKLFDVHHGEEDNIYKEF